MTLERAQETTRGRAYRAALAGRRVAVVGLGRSGIAAARLLRVGGRRRGGHRRQARSTRCRPRRAPSPRSESGSLDTAAGPLREAELVVVSPGVPVDGEQLALARRRGVPIIGELELGWRSCEAEAVAITGHQWEDHDDRADRRAACARRAACPGGWQHRHAAGGRGSRPSRARDGSCSRCRASSSRRSRAFRPRLAVVLNVTPDHLDRHRTLEAYTAAKARIFENQQASDGAVLNDDDEGARALATRVRGDLVWFSRRRELPRGVFVRDGWIVTRLHGAE